MLDGPFWLPFFGVALTAFGGMIGAVIARRPAMKQAETSENAIIFEGFKALMEQLQNQNHALAEKVEHLSQEVADLGTHIDMLNAELRRHNIEPPVRKRKPAERRAA